MSKVDCGGDGDGGGYLYFVSISLVGKCDDSTIYIGDIFSFVLIQLPSLLYS